MISDEELTSWAGTSQKANGPQRIGAVQKCNTIIDAGDSLALSWAFDEAESLEALVEQENLDFRLDEEELQLPGGNPAVLLSGEVVGEPFVQVVAVLKDGRALVVEARDSGFGKPSRSRAELGTLAVKVARAYGP